VQDETDFYFVHGCLYNCYGFSVHPGSTNANPGWKAHLCAEQLCRMSNASVRVFEPMFGLNTMCSSLLRGESQMRGAILPLALNWHSVVCKHSKPKSEPGRAGGLRDNAVRSDR
jgi:hypothetical protein